MASPIPAGSPAYQTVEAAEVYRCYEAFRGFASAGGVETRDLAHRLVLCEALSVAGEAPVIAASIACAGSLVIEANPQAVRQGTRGGAIDFTVNSLDEALRALRNEIRKGLSIAVCLEGDSKQILLHMAERGVQPDVICCQREPDELLTPFLERGAHLLDLRGAPVNPEVAGTRWRVQQLPGKWLPLVDEVVAACLPTNDSVRRDWLKRAPRYLDKLLRTEHYLPMTEREMQRCVELLREGTQDPRWSGLEVRFRSAHSEAEFRRE